MEERVAIIGSGGIGGYLAGELQRAGRDVTLCVRTPFDRLVVTDGGVEREVPVAVETDPAGVAPARWVLVTTKAQEVAGAAGWLEALVGPDTTVVVVQNGVDHEARVRPHLPADARVLPAIIQCAVERTAPGRIVHHGFARISVPAGPEGKAFAVLFGGTAFTMAQEADFLTVAWRKLLSNAAGNPITALTLRRLDVFGDDRIRALAAEVMAETIAVARAVGAKLTQDDADRVLSGYDRSDSSGSSMLYDRLAGRPLEHEFISGAVVAAGEAHGVPTPLNRAILALAGAVSGRSPAA